MLKDSLGGTYRKVIVLQSALTAFAAFVGGVVGGAGVGVSLLAGGAAVAVGSLAYAFLARQSVVSAVSGRRVLARHALAEATKLIVALGLVYAAFASGWFVPWALLAGVVVAVLAHGIALATIR